MDKINYYGCDHTVAATYHATTCPEHNPQLLSFETPSATQVPCRKYFNFNKCVMVLSRSRRLTCRRTTHLLTSRPRDERTPTTHPLRAASALAALIPQFAARYRRMGEKESRPNCRASHSVESRHRRDTGYCRLLEQTRQGENPGLG